MNTSKHNITVETYSGEFVRPFNPDPSTINIEDIAHHLSMINRYNGATTQPYSVAEHCVHMARHAMKIGLSSEACLNFLLHDAAEAYLQDVMTPFKKEIPLFEEVEENLLMTIHNKLGVTYLKSCSVRPFIKECDKRIILNERDFLMPNHRPENTWMIDDLKPLPDVDIQCWSWYSARARFLYMFEKFWRPCSI